MGMVIVDLPRRILRFDEIFHTSSRQGSFNGDRQLGEVIAGLPDNSVYLALIAEVGIPVPAAIRDEGL